MKSLSIIFFCLLPSSLLFSQTIPNAFKIRAGANYSDMNYGMEFVSAFLPRDEYQSYTAGASPGTGYYFGVGLSRQVSSHFEFFTNLDFARYTYVADGDVARLNPTISRPLQSDVPLAVDGKIFYSFANFDIGMNYYFSKQPRQGFFLSAILSGQFLLDKNWKMDVAYEDGSFGESTELPTIDGVEYNEFLTSLGVGIGYSIPIGNRFDLVPLVEFRSAPKNIVDNNLAFTTFHYGVEGKYRF
jgi:hypothetical protein